MSTTASDWVGVGLENVVFFARISRMDVTKGDPDVHTKDGRQTKYEIAFGKPRLEHDKTLVIPISYRVEEVHSDYTTLEKSYDRRYDLPEHIQAALRQRRTRLEDFRPWEVSGKIDGKFHGTMQLKPDCPYVSSIDFRIDGVGDDDEGNANLFVVFSVPFGIASEPIYG